MPSIRFPEKVCEMYVRWKTCTEPDVGWCFVCNSPIRSEKELIPGTNHHNCVDFAEENATHANETAQQQTHTRSRAFQAAFKKVLAVHAGLFRRLAEHDQTDHKPSFR